MGTLSSPTRPRSELLELCIHPSLIVCAHTLSLLHPGPRVPWSLVPWPSPITCSSTSPPSRIYASRAPACLLSARPRYVIRPSSMPQAYYNNLPRHRNRRRPSPSTGIITSPALRRESSHRPCRLACLRAKSFHTSSKTQLLSPANLHHIDLLPRFRPSFAITRPAEPGLSSPKRFLTIVGIPAPNASAMDPRLSRSPACALDQG